MPTEPTTPAKTDAFVAKAQADVKTAEVTISGWHINGWLAIGIAVVANVVGLLFHI